MDNKDTKRRVALSYIVMAISVIAVFTLSYVLRTYNSTPADENTDTDIVGESNTEDEVIDDEPEKPDPETVGAQYCVSGIYRYKIIADEQTLAALGLPGTVTDEMRGAKFADADNNISLYAYPDYACRAYLIAELAGARSFCILDGFTDTSGLGNAAALLRLYGINTREALASADVVIDDTARTLGADETDALYDAMIGSGDAVSKSTLANGVTLVLKSTSGAALTVSYHDDLDVLYAHGASFSVSGDSLYFLR